MAQSCSAEKQQDQSNVQSCCGFCSTSFWQVFLFKFWKDEQNQKSAKIALAFSSKDQNEAASQSFARGLVTCRESLRLVYWDVDAASRVHGLLL